MNTHFKNSTNKPKIYLPRVGDYFLPDINETEKYNGSEMSKYYKSVISDSWYREFVSEYLQHGEKWLETHSLLKNDSADFKIPENRKTLIGFLVFVLVTAYDFCHREDYVKCFKLGRLLRTLESNYWTTGVFFLGVTDATRHTGGVKSHSRDEDDSRFRQQTSMYKKVKVDTKYEIYLEKCLEYFLFEKYKIYHDKQSFCSEHMCGEGGKIGVSNSMIDDVIDKILPMKYRRECEEDCYQEGGKKKKKGVKPPNVQPKVHTGSRGGKYIMVKVAGGVLKKKYISK